MQAFLKNAEPVDDAPARPRARLRRIVAGLLASRAVPGPFSDDDTLAEIGLTSVDMVGLMLAVESEFAIELPQSEITADVFRSVATLEALVARLAPQA